MQLSVMQNQIHNCEVCCPTDAYSVISVFSPNECHYFRSLRHGSNSQRISRGKSLETLTQDVSLSEQSESYLSKTKNNEIQNTLVIITQISLNPVMLVLHLSAFFCEMILSSTKTAFTVISNYTVTESQFTNEQSKLFLGIIIWDKRHLQLGQNS